MANQNPMCCGGYCNSAHGEVRVYPLGGGANLILCRACWQHENQYRRDRVRSGRVDPDAYPQHDWDRANVYREAEAS